jgi:Domain of unknown function (DUF4258)
VKVRIDPHTVERAKERGATLEQIIDVISSGTPVEARPGRLAKEKLYGYYGVWKNVYYDHKLIKVIYAVEGDAAVTITVVVKYGRWEEPL